jgi:neutral ceramidase
MDGLLAGVARTVITPPVGIPMVGFAGRGPAEGVQEDLLATTLALESGGRRAFLIAFDLIGVSDRFASEVRAEIARRTGAPEDHVLLCASHTHYGPVTGAYETDVPADVAAYVANLKFLLAGTAQSALAQMQPVQIGFAEGASAIGINRRERRPDGQIVLGQNPEGACDRSVRLARLDTAEGKPLAALVSFACHPVSAAHAMRLLSPDYIGVMRTLVETTTGATCLFLQGAAGNINPIEMRPSFEPARRLGAMLGGEVVTLFEGTATAAAEGLAAASVHLDLPAMRFTSEEEGERSVADLQAALERLRAEGASEGSVYWAESRLRRAEKMRDSLRTGEPLLTISAELNALRFGDVALATAPGEIFTETGMEVKRRSPLPNTCFAAYTNGTIGYVPIPAAYAEGGYEVTHACRVAPEAAGMIAETALTLLQEVAGLSPASDLP